MVWLFILTTSLSLSESFHQSFSGLIPYTSRSTSAPSCAPPHPWWARLWPTVMLLDIRATVVRVYAPPSSTILPLGARWGSSGSVSQGFRRYAYSSDKWVSSRDLSPSPFYLHYPSTQFAIHNLFLDLLPKIYLCFVRTVFSNSLVLFVAGCRASVRREYLCGSVWPAGRGRVGPGVVPHD